MLKLIPAVRSGLLAAALLAGCSMAGSGGSDARTGGGTNNPPYPVDAGWVATGPGTTSGTVTQSPSYVVSNTATYYYQLQIQAVGGLDDPDGDTVVFASDTLPAYMSLDAQAGLVTIDHPLSQGSVTIKFWSVDSRGADTSAAPYTVTFNFVLT